MPKTAAACASSPEQSSSKSPARYAPLAMRTMSPEERREVERGETDERNVYIRARAAQDSWYWTLALLWVPFVAALVQGETLWMVLCPAVIVLHCAFYMFHMYRWSKKL